MKNFIFIIITVIATSFASEVTIAQGKLSFDACVWGRYYFLAADSANNKTRENSFTRLFGFLGITGAITDYAKVRFYYDMGDIAGKPAYDIFISLSKKGYELRLGQFKPPTGIENLTPPPKLDFIDYTTLSQYRTATGPTRDIGLQVSAKKKDFECAIAIINGNGRNQVKDDNKWKDIVARVVFTPDQNLGLTFGGNIYLGKVGPDTALKKANRFGAELALVNKPIFVKSEFVIVNDSNINNKGVYFALGYRYKNFQPVARAEIYPLTSSLIALTGGINWFIKDENIKPMLNYTYTSDKNKDKRSHKLSGQLQISF
uniref:Porin n=1 Tax=candidate division WOR-3 bacterium TaxID=2052148 RepID=A0A7C6EHD7_UNCW3